MKKWLFMILTCIVCITFIPQCGVKAANKETPEFELLTDTNGYVNKAYNVEVNFKSDDIVTAKWASGKRDAAYFKKKGENIVIEDEEDDYGYFEVYENNTYTVYVKNKIGKEKIKTIEISNLDMKAPSIDVKTNGKDRRKSTITLDIKDASGIDEILYYYGKLQSSTDKLWEDAIETDSETFDVFKNGTISIRVTDKAGNIKVKRVEINTINVTNSTIVNTLGDTIEIRDYYGLYSINVNDVKPVTIRKNMKAYLVTCFYHNTSYSKPLYISDQSFKVYDANGVELKTSSLDYNLKDMEVTVAPKAISITKDYRISFLVYATQAPAYLKYSFWDANMNHSSVRIEAARNFKQVVGSEQELETNSIDYVNNLALQDGGSYTGQYINTVVEGYGTYTDKDGNVYTGFFDHGKMNGYGVMKYKSGASYVGDFIDGQRSGYGINESSTSALFKGVWSNDAFSYGMIYWPDNTHFWSEPK